MSNFVLGVNPKILKWARERAGYSLDNVAQAFGKDVQIISDWESGNNLPTYRQLEKLAYQLYKRPIALFFFPEPPTESEPKQSFRTLPDFEINNLSQDTRYAIRQAKAMQLALVELNNGVNPNKNKIFRDVQVNKNLDAKFIAKTIREYLDIPLNNQMKWKNKEQALEEWRNIIQEKGVFIFKRSFKQKDISGFCLVDKEFPVIYLNNSTAPSRQIFTIFHELGHILLNSSGITKFNDSYISSLVGDSKNIEVFCNQFAAEFLVPSDDFSQWLNKFENVEKMTDSLSAKYKVSREVILRKLLDMSLVSQEYYNKKTSEWNDEYHEFVQKRKEKGAGGGDYYATQAVYLGDKYLSLAFNKYYQGHCNIDQLADYLNIKVKSISGLEKAILGRV